MARAMRWVALGVISAGGLLGDLCAPVQASTRQLAMMEDYGALSNTTATLQRMRLLGVSQLRLSLPWQSVAPQPGSYTRPRGFRASDPAAYPSGIWGGWDAAISQAQADGISVNLDLDSGAPLWATGRNAPRDKPHPSWEPDPAEYAAFVHAVGVRYSGNYNPTTDRVDPGNPNDLPAVNFWSIWNEPNYGPSLAPQGVSGHLSIEHAPALYRGLVDGAWSALNATGHGHDTILFGEVAPRGFPAVGGHGVLPWGKFSGMKALHFLRYLYCVDDSYRTLRGEAAAIRGCPATAAGSRRFRVAHPGLFQASGFANHPYSRWYPPDMEPQNDPDYSSLADTGQLTRALDRVQRVYGSTKRLPIWNTEYGYITSPPKHPTRRIPYVSQQTAAAFLNQAEYISWRNPRIMSFMQYLLYDGVTPTAANDYGGFASGLIDYRGRQKATYSAWRLPLYLPKPAARASASLEVWGCVRPAFFALQDVPGDTQTVQIQFAPGGSNSFTTVASATVTNPLGYFDTRVRFPGSGTVRLTWTYPGDDPLLAPGYQAYSRHVQITLS